MANLLNKKVRHFGRYGVGTVIEQNDTSITVEFSEKTCKFQYPAAFEKFLTAEDKNIADDIDKELIALKEAEEAAKAEKAASKAAEEKAKLEELKAKASVSGKKTSVDKVYKPVQRTEGKALTYLVFRVIHMMKRSAANSYGLRSIVKMEEQCTIGIVLWM